MRTALLAIVMALGLQAQQATSWRATTGDVSLSGAGTTATVQQVATNPQQVTLDRLVVYCSVACNLTQAANGTAATATAGTLVPILPSQPSTPAPANFFTGSNVGAGTDQGGVIHIPAGATVTICLSRSCGNPSDVNLPGGSTAVNYSASVSSITGTANITFFLHTVF